MVRKVIWSVSAQMDRKKILEYWRRRNRSNTYSKKLNRLFKAAVQLIRQYPLIGRPSSEPLVRIKLVKDYLLIYELRDDAVFILAVWDNRQDPEKLSGIFQIA